MSKDINVGKIANGAKKGSEVVVKQFDDYSHVLVGGVVVAVVTPNSGTDAVAMAKTMVSAE